MATAELVRAPTRTPLVAVPDLPADVSPRHSTGVSPRDNVAPGVLFLLLFLGFGALGQAWPLIPVTLQGWVAGAVGAGGLTLVYAAATWTGRIR